MIHNDILKKYPVFFFGARSNLAFESDSGFIPTKIDKSNKKKTSKIIFFAYDKI